MKNPPFPQMPPKTNCLGYPVSLDMPNFGEYNFTFTDYYTRTINLKNSRVLEDAERYKKPII
jgi:hypothetical protein